LDRDPDTSAVLDHIAGLPQEPAERPDMTEQAERLMDN
jgi:hypothetical protein